METKICQNCGMPMKTAEEFGTNKDGSINTDYCVYCIKDGVFMPSCQSCGMPMKTAEDFGTNKDGSKNEDYCVYCFKDGVFTSNHTLDEMIAHNIQYLDVYNQDAEIKVTKDEAIEQLKQHLPNLKRWKNNGIESHFEE
ncbi:MAG: zinc ribbon domain-containing protein [Prevotellaceae bacterium]|jgi:hypothetical protein|nr:zinc ribbon domain-containing protein [Prevotellaceae bacterium]